MAAEISNSILSKIREYLLEPTIHQAGYLYRFKGNIDDLMKEDENLRLVLDLLQHEVERAKSSTEEIEKDVQKWLTDVSNVIADVQKLEEEILANKTCLNGFFPNWAWRYQLSRKAEEIRSVVLKLLESGKFTRVSRRANLPGIELFTSRDFATFESRKSTLDQVIEALRDDKISMVGIYGIGGVGKTTLAKEVGKKVKELNVFDNVVLATVSQTPNFRNIQAQIADSLSLKLDEESEDGRARQLCVRLKNEKKILIILDDVWAKIDLTNIGIPSGDDHKVGKILLTTRRTHVCTTMGCESIIQLNVLKEEEGLALLKKNAGIGDDLPTLNALAKEVARECKGLPLAIVTIGSALKGKAIDVWKLLSQKLKNSKFVDVDDVDTNVYACLKLSYDYLNDEKTKFCLLLCSLFPEDFEIPLEELVRCGRGIGLYKDANSIEEARSQVRVMVNSLKTSGLLLDGRKEEFVKMHDVVRDVALRISSNRKKKFMSKVGLGLTEWPVEEDLEQYAAISLMFNILEVLPVGLKCPKLEIFLLYCYPDNRKLVEIPDQLFVEMKALKVVSLSCGDMSLNALQFLRNIRSLLLYNCKLRGISAVGTLNLLEIVSFRGSSFEELPKEFGLLGKLRLLDLQGCYKLRRIPSNVIKGLSQLEELYIGDNSIVWAVRQTGKVTFGNVSLFELNSLSHLGQLSLSIDHGWIPKDFNFPKLRRYDITVNPYAFQPYFDREDESVPMGSLRIQGIRSTSLIAFKELYETLQYLELRKLRELRLLWKDCSKDLSLHNLTDVRVSGCPRLRSCIFTVSLARSLEQLKVLQVSDCQNLTYIINIPEEEEAQLDDNLVDGFRKEIVFPNLQKLILSKLRNLIAFCPQNYHSTPALERLQVQGSSYLGPSLMAEELVEDHLESPCFPNLSEIAVEECHKLKSLFPVTIARNLLKLKQLAFNDCQQLEQIIVEDNDDKEFKEIMLRGVCLLSLENLPNLVNFCPVNYHFVFPSLSNLTVRNCPKMTTSISVAQNGTVHVHAKTEAQQEDVSAESPAQSTMEISCYSTRTLPPYMDN